MVHRICRGVTGYNFLFLSLKTVFAFNNSVHPDEMPHRAAFHRGLHCFAKYAFRSDQSLKGETCMLCYPVGLEV